MSIPRFHNHRKTDGPSYLDRVQKGLERGTVPQYAFDDIDLKAERYPVRGKLNIKREGPTEQ